MRPPPRGVEPPKRHDVGELLVQHRDRLPERITSVAERLTEISHRLRREREVAFYGDDDFIPTDEDTRDEAQAAVDDARFVLGPIDAFG